MRKEKEIFSELESVCASPGYGHALAALCFRDNFIKLGEKLTTKDMVSFHKPERLCRNETAVLIGLMVKGSDPFKTIDPATLQAMADRSEKLLSELHESMHHEFLPLFKNSLEKGSELNPFKSGIAQRESIFYSAESAYNFQFVDFLIEKYQQDNAWFEKNKGYSITDAQKLIKVIAEFQNKHVMRTLNGFRKLSPDQWTLLPGFMFSTDEIIALSGFSENTVNSFLESLSCPNGIDNSGYNSIDDFNYTDAYPLIKVEPRRYACFQGYGLAQAFYETPFFWMLADKEYKSRALDHRGKFTERISKSHLIRVFGENRVFDNVIIKRKGHRDVVAEIDVLVLFGDRAIVLQAKAKKLTLQARKGDETALSNDFKQAIQESYDQALACSKLLLDPEFELYKEDGKLISSRGPLKEIYPMCIVSDNYPGLNFQARIFLEYENTDSISPPLVTDIFFLDVLCEMLRSPLLFISYLNRRLRYHDQVSSSNEFSVLGYHLTRNLWLEPNNFMHLQDNVSTDLDIAMFSRRASLPGEKVPTGLLTKVVNEDLPIGKIIAEIEDQENPSIIDFGLLIFTFSEGTINQLNSGIRRICALTRTRNDQHDFTIAIANTGITIHSNDAPLKVSGDRLRGHCQRRKYIMKSEKWFGILLGGDQSLRNGLRLEYPYEQSREMDDEIKSLNLVPTLKDGKIHDFSGQAKKKLGRNDPCPCGSGIKFKKCCM